MNAQEPNCTTPSAMPCRPPVAVLEVAPGVRWLRMALPFALDHINLWLLRDRRTGRGLDHRRLRHHQRRHPRRLGAGLRRALRRPAGAAPDRHPHAPRPHRPGALADRTLANPAVDQRHRLQRRAHGQPEHHRLRRRGPAAFFASHGLTDPEPAPRCGRAELLRQHGAERARAFRRLMDGRRSHRRPRLALPCRLRARAGTHRTALPRLGLLIGRHGAAAHLHQRERQRPRARVGPADAVPDLARALEALPATRWCCPRMAGRSPACTAASTSCTQHHEERFAEVMAACAAHPRHAAELLLCCSAQARPAPDTFAMGESLAHLHALWHEGRLARTSRRRRRLALRPRLSHKQGPRGEPRGPWPNLLPRPSCTLRMTAPGSVSGPGRALATPHRGE